MKKTFVDAYFSREDRFCIGTETTSSRHYVSFPVSIGVVDYEEYYEITTEQYRSFLGDHAAALDFVNACRRREHDDLLMQKPGWNRGTPT